MILRFFTGKLHWQDSVSSRTILDSYGVQTGLGRRFGWGAGMDGQPGEGRASGSAPERGQVGTRRACPAGRRRPNANMFDEFDGTCVETAFH